jgi:hypothetical protein
MFEGTDSLFNLEFTYAEFQLRSQKLKIPTAITETQNIYCDHRNSKYLLWSQKLKISTVITETQNIYCDHRNSKYLLW